MATFQFSEAGRHWKTQHRTYWNTSVGSRALLRKQTQTVRQLIILAFRLPDKLRLLLLRDNLSLKASFWVASAQCPDRKKVYFRIPDFHAYHCNEQWLLYNKPSNQLREKDEEFKYYSLTMDQGTDSTYIAKLFYLLTLMINLQLPRN